ncbi:hypothetical protein CEE58_01595 [Stenotrophomonas maltophilia]|nr:hypothetical protein CEE58_01595 [Stenotrophomonas maltophilia]
MQALLLRGHGVMQHANSGQSDRHPMISNKEGGRSRPNVAPTWALDLRLQLQQRDREMILSEHGSWTAARVPMEVGDESLERLVQCVEELACVSSHGVPRVSQLVFRRILAEAQPLHEEVTGGC